MATELTFVEHLTCPRPWAEGTCVISLIYPNVLWGVLFWNVVSQRTKRSPACNSWDDGSASILTSQPVNGQHAFPLHVEVEQGHRTCFATGRPRLRMCCHGEAYPLGYLPLQQSRTPTKCVCTSCVWTMSPWNHAVTVGGHQFTTQPPHYRDEKMEAKQVK